MDNLRQVFLDFTSFGAGQAGSSEMDSAKFVKLAKDCKLVGQKLSTTDLDLIFTKVKDKAVKKINFETFIEAVKLIAEKTNKSTEDVVNVIVSAKGPTTGAATLAENVKFHDDKSTFTGVHNHGGPSQIDRHNVDMAHQLDRAGGADVRGVKDYSDPGPSARRLTQEEVIRRTSRDKAIPKRGSSQGVSAPRRYSTPQRDPADGGGAAAGAWGDGNLEQRVADVFVAFASSVAKASGDMDGMKFFKLMGDCGLVGKSLSRTDCDLIFTKTCSSSGCVKKINFDAFRKIAIPLVSEHLEADEGTVLARVASVPGVSSSGTVAQASRFHDDKATYTGSHAAGGPTHMDHRVSLESLADRSAADVRGVQARGHQPDPGLRASGGGRVFMNQDDYNRKRSSGSVACGAAMVAPMRKTSDATAGSSGSGKRSSGSSVDSGGVTGNGDRRKSSLAEAGGTIAGSANKKGGVYDRLCDQSSYTGVYAERFKNDGSGGGRINGDTVNIGVSFSGSTNSGGDHAVRELSQICSRR